MSGNAGVKPDGNGGCRVRRSARSVSFRRPHGSTSRAARRAGATARKTATGTTSSTASPPLIYAGSAARRSRSPRRILTGRVVAVLSAPNDRNYRFMNLVLIDTDSYDQTTLIRLTPKE
jgi:hypothetical protein